MLILVLYGVFGAIVGSFLNVLVLRRSVTTLGGRSACMSCETQLRWYDLIPIFSWIALRGKCRSCESAVSAQYPIVEASTALAFILFGSVYGVTQPVLSALSCAAAAILIAIAAYDLRHTIIPDEWAYAFAILALVISLSGGVVYGMPPLYSLLAGPVAALPLATLWFVSGGRWIGLGDAKLALGIGWLLGPVYGVTAVFFAFVVGAVITVGILMPAPYIARMVRQAGIARFRSSTTSLTMHSEVAFGPFLVISCFAIWYSILHHIPLPW